MTSDEPQHVPEQQMKLFNGSMQVVVPCGRVGFRKKYRIEKRIVGSRIVLEVTLSYSCGVFGIVIGSISLGFRINGARDRFLKAYASMVQGIGSVVDLRCSSKLDTSAPLTPYARHAPCM